MTSVWTRPGRDEEQLSAKHTRKARRRTLSTNQSDLNNKTAGECQRTSPRKLPNSSLCNERVPTRALLCCLGRTIDTNPGIDFQPMWMRGGEYPLPRLAGRRRTGRGHNPGMIDGENGCVSGGARKNQVTAARPAVLATHEAGACIPLRLSLPEFPRGGFSVPRCFDINVGSVKPGSPAVPFIFGGVH